MRNKRTTVPIRSLFTSAFVTHRQPPHTLLSAAQAANTKKGSAPRGANDRSMDRNYRYPRRGGCSCEPAHGGNRPPMKPWQGARDVREASPSDNCLCDNQPISLAMSYVKVQPFDAVYEPCDGWKNGTIFPCLYMPYCIGGKKR